MPVTFHIIGSRPIWRATRNTPGRRPAKRRTEKIGVLAYRIGQGTRASFKLSSYLACGLEGKQGMRERVIPNYVPSLCHLARDVRPLLHKASDQEKRSADIVPCQNLQQAQRVRIVGAVIVGQRELLRRPVTAR